MTLNGMLNMQILFQPPVLPNRYGKSRCSRGKFLHKFVPIECDVGILDRCERCGLRVHFPPDIPSQRYLEYNIRRILRADDQLFNHEYK